MRKHEEGYVLHMLNYVITRKAKIMDTIEERFIVCDREVSVRTEECPKEEGYTGIFLRM